MFFVRKMLILLWQMKKKMESHANNHKQRKMEKLLGVLKVLKRICLVNIKLFLIYKIFAVLKFE